MPMRLRNRYSVSAVQGRHLFPVDTDRAGLRPQLAADQFQQGGLAGAARPHDRGHTTGHDIEVDTVKYHALTMRKFQVTNLYNRVLHFFAGSPHL